MTVALPSNDLVERDRELDELRGALAATRSGQGTVIVVEGPAGQGKTALLRALRAEALSSRVHVLTAVGAELERDFPFGVVRQLLEAELHGCDEQRLGRFFDGAAQLARPVFSSDWSHDTTDASFSRLHGLYWLVANLAEEQPLALVLDDAHWADAPSMRFLDMLARRLDGLAVMIAIGARPAASGAQREIVDNLVAGPGVHVLRPRALSPGGVGLLLRSTLGENVEEPFVAAAVHATGGSPLLVRELLRTVVEEGIAGRTDEADRLRRALPRNVGRIVLARMRRLSRDALAVARAVAVLGDGARPVDVSQLADVPQERLAAARDALVSAGLFRPDAFGFVHPVIRAAVHSELAAGLEAAAWHRRAAVLRHRAAADSAEVAAHLLETEPNGEQWAADALTAAGRRALLDGAPDVAVRHLRRALAELPDATARPVVLLAVGQAEARCGGADAAEHLAEAAACGEPGLAVQADRLRAQVLVLQERAGEAVEVLRGALADASDHPELAMELENDLVDVLAHYEPLRAEYLRRLEASASGERPTLLSHLAWVRAIGGAPATEVVALARRALVAPASAGDGRFVHFYALEALMNVEAADDCAAALRDANAIAQRLGSTVAAGPLTYMTSSWAAWERAFGDLRHAEQQARYGLDLMLSAKAPAVIVTLRSSLAAILLDRGDIDAADEQFALLPARETGQGLKESHGMRARLRLLQGRPHEALAELETELALERARGWVVSNREPSRTTLVRVLLALARGDEARRAAEREVALAQRRGVAGAEARARLSLALTLDPGDAIDELRVAAEVARRSPSRVVQAEVLGELGSRLRRCGERVAAREPLAEAREIAHRCGADGLQRRLHDELVIAGARPRRVALSGLESLTAAERRVAELAAQGLRNREIAQTLFVTLKTVEVHLGRAYGKLGIQGRSQLQDALAGDA